MFKKKKVSGENNATNAESNSMTPHIVAENVRLLKGKSQDISITGDSVTLS